MKRAEQMAWAALAGLVAIFAILLTGAIVYNVTAFWAGAMLAAGQAVAIGLAAWGLALARQAREMQEFDGGPAPTRASAVEQPGTGFRMSSSDDTARESMAPASPDAQTLDTGFQRLVVFIAGIVLVALGIVSSVMLYNIWRWVKTHPDLTLAIVGKNPETIGKPVVMDDKALLIGVAAGLIYAFLYWITRPRRGSEEYSEATTSTLTLGICAMATLAIATVLAYFKVVYASEVAAGVVTFFMLLQGLELLVNSFRTYSSIEELDHEAVDLQKLPLVPMLSSVWLNGLRMLFAASVGLSGQARHERGVIARMMPRALLAILIIAIAVSCLRVVPPGEVGVIERLGYAATDEKGRLRPEAILKSGLHLTMPWPIDKLVLIPTERLQISDIGTELHDAGAMKGMNIEGWTFRDGGTNETEIEDLFVTGDPGAPQILETFVNVQWRVTDPAAFYAVLSHSEAFEKGEDGTHAVPIYEAVVKQATAFAVTRTFAIHSLEGVMITNRKEVDVLCKKILQAKLDGLGQFVGLDHCGITVEYLTIKDLHPPFGYANRPNDPNADEIGGTIMVSADGIRIEPDANGYSKMRRGPAAAFENIVAMREFKEQLLALARGQASSQLNEAQGVAESMKKNAQAYSLDKVAKARADNDRLEVITSDKPPAPLSTAPAAGSAPATATATAPAAPLTGEQRRKIIEIAKQQLLYDTIREILDPVNRIIVDEAAGAVQIYQNTEKGPIPLPSP